MGNISNTTRVAKNTLLLYMRTILVMVISLFTSRVVLNTLGVENFGIYNVVGGMVAMFAVISGALSSSISRYITVELGKGNDLRRLSIIFSTSVNIQIVIAILIAVLGEIIGLGYIFNKMTIPFERINAAIWVLQCSLLIFCVNLVSVPYNACIIAHEKMSAFAYVSLLEITLKLLVVYLLWISPIDKLIAYALLLVVVAVLIRLVYGFYCKRHFKEATYHFVIDKALTKEMTSFAGWNFLTNTCYIFNTQGVNLLINSFFGLTLNATRGIATQVDSAIMQFVNNFTTALNPQITKSYAAGEYENMNNLICRGAKFSFYLVLLFTLPVYLETEYILRLWLKIVPDNTVVFLRLTMIGSMVSMLGNTGYVACMATGNIKRYVLILTTIEWLVFPLTWLAFSFGLPAEAAYIAFILVYLGVDIIRLFLMKQMLNFTPWIFVKNVVFPISIVTLFSFIVPTCLYLQMKAGIVRLITVIMASSLSSVFCIEMFGLTSNERYFINSKVKGIIKKIFK